MESVYERYQKTRKDKDDTDNWEVQYDEEEEVLVANDKPADWFQQNFVRKACKILQECRKTLMYSYVFNFYVSDGTTTKTIFEGIQGHLRCKVERLSAFLEREVHTLNENNASNELQAVVEFCEKFLKQLIEYVKEQRQKKKRGSL